MGEDCKVCNNFGPKMGVPWISVAPEGVRMLPAEYDLKCCKMATSLLKFNWFSGEMTNALALLNVS